MRCPPLLLFAILAALFALVSCEEEKAPAASSRSDFIRFVPEGREGGLLETAVVSYRNRDGVRVDLIAAVHLAEPEYYDTLELLFPGYDSLLYELVAPKDAIPQPGRKDDNLLSRMQKRLCRAMDLDYQLDAVDYSRDNFVHADLTPEDFARIWRERGETLWSLLFSFMKAQYKAMEEGMGQHLTSPRIFEALRSPDSAERFKYLLAREFEHIEAMLAGLEEEGNEKGSEKRGSMLIGERNRAAVDVLKKEMARGQRRLGIFYGAAHMPDFEIRLQGELGFAKTKQSWLTAWEIKPRADASEGRGSRHSGR